MKELQLFAGLLAVVVVWWAGCFMVCEWVRVKFNREGMAMTLYLIATCAVVFIVGGM